MTIKVRGITVDTSPLHSQTILSARLIPRNPTQRYNRHVRVRCTLAIVVLSASTLAQSAPPSCPATSPVDYIIAEVHKQQSHMKHRNKDPFTGAVCVWGCCRDRSVTRTPPTLPGSTPEPKPNADAAVSSSAVPVDNCQAAMEMALEAAHNVDVGDYEFASKNYNGALMRYRDAVEEKPGDAAIHVRLGRVFEKLDQVPQAIEEYKAAQNLAGPKKWSDKANEAIVRLQRRQPSGKD